MAESASAPDISVIVPTYNRRDRLARVLQSLVTQETHASFEVVVVSDGSTDGTSEFLTDHHLPLDLRAFEQPNSGPAAARNLGIDHARGELLVFLDDDVVASPGLLEGHRLAHAANDRLVTIGPMSTPVDHAMTPWVRWEQRMLAKQYDAMDARVYEATARQFYTGNAAVRRSAVRDAGGFDTSFRRAEDVELAYRLERAGLGFEFCPDAVGFHYADRSYGSWRSIAYTYGRTDVVFARDRGETWILGFLGEKYREHRAPVRWVVRATATRPWLARMVRWSAGRAAMACERIGAERPAEMLLSVVYAVEYHRGVADELGSALAFKQTLLAPA